MEENQLLVSAALSALGLRGYALSNAAEETAEPLPPRCICAAGFSITSQLETASSEICCPLICKRLQEGIVFTPPPICVIQQDAGSQQIGFLLGSCGVTVALTSDACHKGLPKSATGEIPQFKGESGGHPSSWGRGGLTAH